MNPNDTTLARIARNLAEALMDYAYTRKDEDKKRIAEYQTELCRVVRSEQTQETS